VSINAYVSLNGRQLRVSFKSESPGLTLAGIGVACRPSCGNEQVEGYIGSGVSDKFGILLPNRAGTYQVDLHPKYRGPNTVRAGKLNVPLGTVKCHRQKDGTLHCTY
jgi:hypothetical protein